MTNPNCGMCGNLNVRGFCNLTACSFPSNKTETIQVKKPTNADRIRSMTDEELANWYFDKFFPCVPYCSVFDECPEHDDCKICLLDWLKQESEDT